MSDAVNKAASSRCFRRNPILEESSVLNTDKGVRYWLFIGQEDQDKWPIL